MFIGRCAGAVSAVQTEAKANDAFLITPVPPRAQPVS